MRNALLLAPLLLLAASPPDRPAEAPVERIVTGDRIVSVTVNGTPLRLRIVPGGQGLPVVTPAVAERLGLRGGGMLAFGVAYAVGRERVEGRTEVTRFGWPGAPVERHRVGWMSRDYPLDGVDGTVGPAGLPEPVVRFALRAPRAGERTVSLPMSGGGGMFGDWMVIGAEVSVGGRPIRVVFNPDGARSTATAPAAARIAAAHGGQLTTETARQNIAFGIERPLRIMTLAQPLVVGPLALSTIAVRVTDGAGANTIREEGADPNEVVVPGRNDRPGSMTLGADQLDRCSSIVFDRRARQVRLTCG